ncbi:hypothetical protein PS1M3_38730 [Pseudoalteromonas sp. PS1M3]|uniref:hypothetical protein n=1 Tax=unclassified Pseudoalteromonas TaxID=194690 RepID=UPI00110CB998|nr:MULTISPECIES: hypothetical protein [unclassified Pseudoalteromonas]TMS81241.1 hypothetical protein CWB65_11090 [Pseudoalteromonas sp. S554]BBW93786.1 hypothetical protein PS1M3_38730 [Pseudoalteromonas sp. PS1M3]
MSKLNETWDLFALWISKKIRSPFSNFATKFTLIIGSTIVASPIIEHLLFNAILKQWLNIDLNIEVPDLNAYIFGSSLIVFSLIHNLIYVKLTNQYQVKLKEVEGSVYKKLWEHLDTVIDNSARLINLYTKVYDESFDEYALKAEESIIACADFLRKNRPFFFSENFYEKCVDINSVSYKITEYYRVCLKAQKYDKGLLKSQDINNVSLERVFKEFNFLEAQKDVKNLFSPAKEDYELICSEIRKRINAI